MVIIICACLPVLQTLMRRMWDSGFGFSTLRSRLLGEISRRSDHHKSGYPLGGVGGAHDSDWSRIKGEGRKSSSGEQLSETQISHTSTTKTMGAAEEGHPHSVATFQEFELGPVPGAENQTGRERYETV